MILQVLVLHTFATRVEGHWGKTMVTANCVIFIQNNMEKNIADNALKYTQHCISGFDNDKYSRDLSLILNVKHSKKICP